MATRLVYPFDSEVRRPTLVGGKGANLARLTALGLPVPPGFTITTGAWTLYRRSGEAIWPRLEPELDEALAALEQALGRRLDDPDRPLLVSVRSGAPVSMPGMMDTLLNVGLSDDVVAGFGRRGRGRFADDIYVRLLDAYARVVRGIDAGEALPAGDGELAMVLKERIAAAAAAFPQRAREQMLEAIEAVWRSWDSPRARRYRDYRGISHDLGTAVTVQAMVFGNLDPRSGSGVAFTRDPATGRAGIYGDFLRQAQGEDVVAGVRTPEPLESAKQDVPAAFADLQEVLGIVETSFRDMCDVEFTVESDRLWILQARVGERSGTAAVRIATDMVDEGLIDIETAIGRVPLSALAELQAPVAARDQGLRIIGRGVPASPGTAVGRAVFDPGRAELLAGEGHAVVLIRPETSPKDIGGMIAATGLVTAIGGRASHGAVVARGIGVPAVCGVQDLRFDDGYGGAALRGDIVLHEGDLITVDGNAGSIMMGAARLVPPQPDEHLSRLLSWCDERARVPVVMEPPPGYARVSSAAEALGAAGPVLIDVPWEGPSSAAVFLSICEAALAGDPSRPLALVAPNALRGGDLRPPQARWEAIVARTDTMWVARLLSARIPSDRDPAAGAIASQAAPGRE